MKTRPIIIVLTAAAATTLSGCGGPTQAGLDARAEARDRINSFTGQFTFDQAQQDYESGQFDRALRNVNAAIGESPEIPAYWLLQGQIYFEMNNLEAAITSFASALERDPYLAEAHYFSGIVFQRWSDDERAYEHYLSAYDSEPDQVHYLMATAEALIALGELEDARQLILDKLAYFEHEAALRHLLGQISLLENDPVTAARLYEEARLLNPDDDTILEELAWVQFDAELYGMCYETLRELNEECADERNDLRHLEARCLALLDRSNEAHKVYVDLVRANPSNESVWIEFGTLAWKLGDFRRVAECSVRTIGIAPHRFEGYMLKGLFERHEGREENAISLLNEAADRAMDSALPHLLLGQTLEGAGRTQEALGAYAAAMSIDPANDAARALHASLEQRMHVVSVEVDADSE